MSRDIIVRVLVVDVGVTKAMRFNTEQTVYECIEIAKELAHIPPDKQYLMYIPQNKKCLMNETRLGDEVVDQQQLELRPRYSNVKVKFVDGTIKTILLDFVLPVAQLTAQVAEKMGIRMSDEYALQKEGSTDWLEAPLPLLGQIELTDVLALNKRFYLNDAMIDESDPVQLHLIYSDSKSQIVSGKMPVTPEDAIVLAGLQMHIEKGSREDYIKSGERDPNIDVALPPNMIKKERDKRVAAAVLNEWRRLVGVTDIQGKFRYIQKVRSLDSFGLTIWEIKEKVQGKTKKVDRLFGLTKQRFIRMEMDKTIVQTYELRQIRRWAAGKGCFTLDLGNHFSEYYTAYTEEGEQISQTLGGYIDLLVKKQKESGVKIEENLEKISEVDEISSAMAVRAAATRKRMGIRTGETSAQVITLSDAKRQVERTFANYKTHAAVMSTDMTMVQVEELLAEKAQALRMSIDNIVSEDATKHQAGLTNIGAQTTSLHEAYNAALAAGLGAGILNVSSGEENLLYACRSATEAVMRFLANENSIKGLRANVGQANTMDTLSPELFIARAALIAVEAQARAKTVNDPESQRLLLELAKQIAVAVSELAAVKVQLPNNKAINDALSYLDTVGAQTIAVMRLLAPTSQDNQSQLVINELASAMRGAIVSVLDACKAAGLSEDSPAMKMLWAKAQAVQDALQQLLLASVMPGADAHEHAVELAGQTTSLCTALAAIIDPAADAKVINERVADIKIQVASMVRTGKAVAMESPELKDQIIAAVLKLVDSTKALEAATKSGDKQEIERACDNVRAAIEGVLAASGYGTMASGIKALVLGAAAKAALASTLALNVQAKSASSHVKNPQSQTALLEAAGNVPATIDALLKVLTMPPDELEKHLLTSINKFAPESFRLVAASKMAVPAIDDAKVKAGLVQSSDLAASQIRNLVHQAKIFQPRGKATVQELIAVKDDLQAIASELVQTLTAAKSGELEQYTVGVEAIRDNAFKTLNTYGRAIAGSSSKLQYLQFDEFPKEIDNLLKLTKKVIGVVKGLAGTTNKKDLQTSLLSASLKVMQQVALLLGAASKNDRADLEVKGLAMEELLQQLVAAGREIIVYEMEQLQAKQEVIVQDVAERELMGAANVINDALKRIIAAQQAAKTKAAEAAAASGVRLEEGLNERILEYAREVVQNSSELINTATDAQREINGHNPRSGTASVSVYKRDPKWEQGLISAAKAVAGSVQYLVRSANEHMEGEEAASALVATAHTVAANAAQLTTSSRTKLDPSSQMIARLQTNTAKVNTSTQALVQVASQEEDDDADDSGAMSFSYTQYKIKVMEAQLRIKDLEDQIRKAYTELQKMRKDRYADANVATRAPPARGPPGSAGRGRGLPPPGAGRAAPPGRAGPGLAPPGAGRAAPPGRAMPPGRAGPPGGPGAGRAMPPGRAAPPSMPSSQPPPPASQRPPPPSSTRPPPPV